MQTLETEPGTAQRNLQRFVGGALIIYALGVAVQVAARVGSNDSQPVFAESLIAIAENSALYLTSMYAAIVSNLLLVSLSGGIYSVFRYRQADLARCGAFLLLTTGIISLVSGSAGLALASLAQEFVAATGAQATSIASSAQSVELIREYTGRTSFTMAGLGVLTLGLLFAWRRALPAWLGWLGIVVGVMMFFIWSDSATVLHRVGGTGYLLWLSLTGGWLLFRGTRESKQA